MKLLKPLTLPLSMRYIPWRLKRSAEALKIGGPL